VNGLPHVLAVVLLVAGVSGCSLLDLLFGLEPPPFDPDESFPPFPTAEATFTTGSATIELEGETVVLDEIRDDSSLSEYGFSVTWTNGDGWYLQLYGFPEEMPFPGGGYLSLHRIEDNQHLTILDPTRCVTTDEQSDADGIVGSATCRGLLWTDYFSSNATIGGFPQPIPGEEPFDAEITYEAR
jgi:hypothetical protein